MEVVALRRYPVKSMGGESLRKATFDGRGLKGDRWYAVEDDSGHFASGKNTRRFRRRDEIFGYAATTTDTGEVAVTGASGRWTVGDPALDQELCNAMGRTVRVTPEDTVPHQDMGSVSLVGTASLAWCRQRWGINPDPRRLRVNVVFSSDETFIEETWVGKTLAVGTASFEVVRPVTRCRTIDLDQDGADANGRWLKPLAAERDRRIAMYADVAEPGVMAVGDRLTVHHN